MSESEVLMAPMSEPIWARAPNDPIGVARTMSVGGILFRRWAGAWIDFIAIGVIILAPGLLVGGDPPGPPAWIGVIAALLYFPITEGVWGRTLGKLITGTIVVNKAGKPPGIAMATLRTILRILEVNPFLLGGIPAGILVWNTKAHQRLGDILAGTYVLPVKDFRLAAKSSAVEQNVASTFD